MTQTLLTTEQVARRIGRSVSQVNRLAKAGDLLPAHQGNGVRGARFYEPATVLAYLERTQERES